MFGAALNAQENHVLMLPGLHGSVPVLEKKTISIQRDLCYRLWKEYRVDGPRTKPKNRNLPSRLVVLVIFGVGGPDDLVESELLGCCRLSTRRTRTMLTRRKGGEDSEGRGQRRGLLSGALYLPRRVYSPRR